MSIPKKIFLSSKNSHDIVTHFYKSIEFSNNFNKNNYYTDIDIIKIDENLIKERKEEVRKIYLKLGEPDLPRYVKSLCTLNNYINYLKYIKKRRFLITRDI